MVKAAGLAREALEARELWGSDQGGYEAAVRAEIVRLHPQLDCGVVEPILTDLPATQRYAVLENVISRRKEQLRWEQVKEACVMITPRLLKAAEVIGASESLECWYLYPEGAVCKNGLRQKQVQLLGPAIVKGCALVRRWHTEAAGQVIPVEFLRLTKATAMRLECIAREQELTTEERCARMRETHAIPFARPLPATTGKARDNRGQFAPRG